MKHIANTALLLAALLQRADSATQNRQATTYGPASLSCGAFIAAGPRDHQMYGWWVLGVISGAALYWDVPLAKTDPDGIISWVNHYCAEHPLDELVTATQNLVTELGIRGAIDFLKK